MKFKFIIFLISLSLCKYLLYIEHMYTIKDKNNFSIIFDINTLNISNKINSNNIFNIILESENLKEKNYKIIFKCEFIYLYSNNSQIKCSLKKKISSHIVGPFYFRQEYFKKSFNIKIEDNILNFTLDIKEEEFYIGMIRNFRIKKNKIDFNYKISHIIIPISMSLNNDYIYPTIVAITSILENANYYTKYDFYILHTPNFLSENKNKLKYFEIKYYDKCSINLIDMKNFKFKNAFLSGHINTIAAYYRIVLSELLPNIDKIIYLDGDTLTFNDLKEMYDINMDNYYYKGFLDISIDPFLAKNKNYICSGVLLINLENIRKDDIVNEMFNYMIKNNKSLYFHDQTIINGVCSKKIGILPPKFGIFNQYNFKKLYKITKKVYRKKNVQNRYSYKQLKEAYLHPTILHCVIKPWIKKKRKNYANKIWLKYANKTNYYKEIINEYKIL